ncbi:MAG: type III-B CRISPR module RAMP protein Cmr6 [Gammaproteobacteria bacterium]
MIPAVPAYLGKQFDTAPPGHRFSLYFPVWNPESWEIEKTKKAEALKKTLNLPPASRTQIRAQIDALRKRQRSLLFHLDENSRFIMQAVATAPLVTGMGMEHPLENGFAFLNPYGVPYLPGSSIKGVLRRAAEELVESDNEHWSNATVKELFGHQGNDDARRGALTFWDIIPEIKGNTLAMDVMTPHYSEYYQCNSSPHDAGQPNPIVFMVIPPESNFSFYVTANEERLPDDFKDGKWKALMESAFEHAFDWIGFGAKTAVGYGAMKIDEEGRREPEKTTREEAEQQAREKALAERTAGMPEDAAWLIQQQETRNWNDRNTFLSDVEKFLEGKDMLSNEAISKLSILMREKWSGIMENPDAMRGKKKNKPKYKDRPRNLAKKIKSISNTQEEQ